MELVYCFKCRERILAEEFRKGRAIRKWNDNICFACATKMGLHNRPKGQTSTETKPVSVGSKNSPRPPRETSRRVRTIPPPQEEPVRSSSGNLNLVLGGVVGLLLVVVVLIFLLRGESKKKTPELPPPKTAETLTPPPIVVAPAVAAPTSPEEMALADARAFVKANHSDFNGQVELFEAAIVKAENTPSYGLARRELQQLLKKHRTRVDLETRGLSKKIEAAQKAGEFGKALALVKDARATLKSLDWEMLLDKRKRILTREVEGEYVTLVRTAMEAKKKGETKEVAALRERVVTWGVEDLVKRLDEALSDNQKVVAVDATPPKSTQPETKPKPKPKPKPSVNPEAVEAKLYRKKWVDAMEIAADRDYVGAIRALEGLFSTLKFDKTQGDAISDVELLRELPRLYGEIRNTFTKLKKRQQISLEYKDAEGKLKKVKGRLEEATAWWVKVETTSKDKKGKEIKKSVTLDLPILETPSLLQFYKGDEDGALALFKRIEGLEAKGDLPKKYVGWKRLDEGDDFEAEAKASDAYGLFFSAYPKERELELTQRRGGTVAIYRKLLKKYSDTPIVRRFREIILARSTAAPETLFLGRRSGRCLEEKPPGTSGAPRGCWSVGTG